MPAPASINSLHHEELFSTELKNLTYDEKWIPLKEKLRPLFHNYTVKEISAIVLERYNFKAEYVEAVMRRKIFDMVSRPASYKYRFKCWGWKKNKLRCHCEECQQMRTTVLDIEPTGNLDWSLTLVGNRSIPSDEVTSHSHCIREDAIDVSQKNDDQSVLTISTPQPGSPDNVSAISHTLVWTVDAVHNTAGDMGIQNPFHAPSPDRLPLDVSAENDVPYSLRSDAQLPVQEFTNNQTIDSVQRTRSNGNAQSLEIFQHRRRSTDQDISSENGPEVFLNSRFTSEIERGESEDCISEFFSWERYYASTAG